MSKINRNAPCPCGSGLKFKKCCLGKETSEQPVQLLERLRKTEEELFNILFKQAQEQLGPEGITKAWQTFCQKEDVPLDPQTQPEINTSFLSWLLLHWHLGSAQQQSETLATRYRQRMDHRLPILQRRFIDEACQQPFSFFVVTDINPGTSVTLHDLFWSRELEVFEQKASTLLSRGNILYTQVLPMDNVAIFLGCAPLAIPDAYQVRLIEVRDTMAEKLGSIDRDALFSMESQLRACYFDIRNEMQKMDEEQEQATEDVPAEDKTETTPQQAASAIASCDNLSYNLDCSVREAFEALRTLSWKLDDDALPADTEMDEQGQPCRMVFPWLEKGNRKPSKTENPELARIIIEENRLTVELMDAEQKDSMLRKITRRLGKQATLQDSAA